MEQEENKPSRIYKYKTTKSIMYNEDDLEFFYKQGQKNKMSFDEWMDNFKKELFG